MSRAKQEVLQEGLTELGRLTDALELNDDVFDRAAQLFRKAIQSDTDFFSGRSVQLVTATCVMLASRETTDTRSAEEIAAHLPDHLKEKTLYRTGKAFVSELDVGFILANPHRYVDAIADELNLPAEDRELAHDIVKEVLEDGVASGHKAAVIAASAVYITGNLDGGNGDYTQRELAEAAGVSRVAIRESYRKFARVFDRTNSDVQVAFV